MDHETYRRTFATDSNCEEAVEVTFLLMDLSEEKKELVREVIKNTFDQLKELITFGSDCHAAQ